MYAQSQGLDHRRNTDLLASAMSKPHEKHQHSLAKHTGLLKRLSHTQSFKGHSSTVNALDWSPDGEILLSGSDDCRIKLWNAESGKALHTFDSVRLQHQKPLSAATLFCCTKADLVIQKLNSAGSHIKHVCVKIPAKLRQCTDHHLSSRQAGKCHVVLSCPASDCIQCGT